MLIRLFKILPKEILYNFADNMVLLRHNKNELKNLNTNKE